METIPAWATDETTTPEWAKEEAPPAWAREPMARPTRINPNGPGGFNSGGTPDKISAGAPDVGELAGDAWQAVREVPGQLKAGLHAASTALEYAGAAALNIPQAMVRDATDETPQRGGIRRDAQGREQLSSQPVPLFFQPGESPLPSDANVRQPEGSDFNQLLRGFTTPGNIAAFPFSAAKPVQAYFLAQTVPGAVESLAQTLDPKLPAEERRRAAQNALLNTYFSFAIAHHMAAGDPKAIALAQAMADAVEEKKFTPTETAVKPIVEDVPDWARAKPVAVEPNLPANPPEIPESSPIGRAPAPSPLPESTPPIPAVTPPPAEVAPPSPIPTPAAADPTIQLSSNPPSQPKLIPVDVSPEEVQAMHDATGERPPDILDALADVTSKPVRFAEKDYATTIDNARQATLTKAGRPSAATARLDKLIHTRDGLPADQALNGLARENPKYADWTPDDLAQAIINAHAARESGGNSSAARQLAEAAKRTQHFEAANRASRPGSEAVPAPHLFVGDTFTLNGHEQRVTGFGMDAETDLPTHVETDGAYGRQDIPADGSIHLDEGSLRGEHEQVITPANPEAIAAKREAFRQKLQDVPPADAAYDALPESHGGRLVSTDTARHLEEDYHASFAGRVRWTKATSAPARDFITGRLRRTVSEPAKGRRLEIIAGGIASGKTQSIQAALANLHAIVWETPLRDPKLAEEIIRTAVQNGWEVNVRHIHRPMANVLPAYLARTRNEGRWSYLADVLASHRESQTGVLELRKTLAELPHVAWKFYKNEGTREKPLPLREVKENAVAPGGEAWHSVGEDYENADANLAERAYRQAVASGQIHPEVFGQIALPDRRSVSSGSPSPSGSVSPGDDQPRANPGLTGDSLANVNSGALGNVGMGGAKPGEFTPSRQTATGIKNATVDVERAQRGLPPAMQAARRTFGEVWDHAMAVLDQQPDRTDNLLAELRTKPRALTDTEDALLLHRQIDLQNDYAKATRELAQAYDDAKQFPNREADVQEWKLRTAKLSDQLQDLYDVNKAAGTETGRGLAARKLMAYEDFTLAKMEVEMRAAKGGDTLSVTEKEEVAGLQRRIEQTQKAFDDYRAKAEEELAKRRVQDEIDERIKQVEKTPGYDRQVQTLADRIVTALEAEAVKARARL